MKIGFDLDGVLCDLDISILRCIDFISDPDMRRSAEEYYYKCRKPLLNPYYFLSEEDEGYIITARPLYLEEITRKWVKQFYPTFPLIILGHTPPFGITDEKEIRKWLKREQLMKKVEKIKELNLEIYIDDTPSLVVELRKLCPNTKIIKFGGIIG